MFHNCFTHHLLFNRVARSFSDASTFFTKADPVSATLPRHGFSRFEEKKRHNQEVKSTAVKSLFRKTPNKIGSPMSRESRSKSPESHSAIQDLGLYLQTLPQSVAHHAYGFLKTQVEKLDRLASSGVLSPMDLSDRVHTIYQNFEHKLRSHTVFSGIINSNLLVFWKFLIIMIVLLFPFILELNSNSVEPLLDHGERYLTRLMYRKFFCPPNCDDEERDLAVQKRIRGLNWISAPLLDCKINELDPKVRDILEKAITRISFTFYCVLNVSLSFIFLLATDLIEMDGQRAPQDKLASIIDCSKLVFEMLSLSDSSTIDQLSEKVVDIEDQDQEAGKATTEAEASEPSANTSTTSHPVSADDFLPALIYVVLRANPPRIHSNLNFITRYLRIM